MKRTKLISTLAVCVLCLSFLVVGVWAVTSTANLNINGNLKFYPEGLFVELSGHIERGTTADNTHIIDSNPNYIYGPVSNFDGEPEQASGNFPIETWEIGNIAFIPNQRYIKIVVTITNYSDFSISGTPVITIDGQDITTNTPNGLAIIENATEEISNITSLTTATYSITLEATETEEFSKSINVSIEFLEKEPEVLDLNGLQYEIIEGTKNVTITDYTGSAQNIVLPESFSFAEKEMSNTITLESWNEDSILDYIVILAFGDFNVTFGNGTKREEINFIEFLLEMESLPTDSDAFPITIEQTYNLKIENNEMDLMVLSLFSNGLVFDGVTVEPPKVKENNDTEWTEFKDMTEFAAYAGNVSSSPETINFPLEFEFTPPKHTVMVEGNEYTITGIGDSAFNDYYNLLSITLPSSLTSIGNGAFYNCHTLVEVYNFSNLEITAGSYSYGEVGAHAKVIHTSKEEPTRINNDGVMQYYEYGSEIIALAPLNRSNITHVTLKSGTTEINDHAFYDCINLISLEIPNSVKTK